MSSIRRSNVILFMANHTRCSINSSSLSLPELVFRTPVCPRVKSASPVMEWQNCTGKMEVDILPRFLINATQIVKLSPWTPFISSVKVLEDNPSLSRWLLKYNAFGRDIDQTLNRKIHWRSLEGLPNSDVVRFYPKGSPSCLVEALQPLLERLLKQGLESFATFVKKYQTA